MKESPTISKKAIVFNLYDRQEVLNASIENNEEAKLIGVDPVQMSIAQNNLSSLTVFKTK